MTPTLTDADREQIASIYTSGDPIDGVASLVEQGYLAGLAAGMERQQARIAELETEAQWLNDLRHTARVERIEQRDRATEAEAALAERDKDAERYRWLRDIGDENWTALTKRKAKGQTFIDAAIDAAIRESKPTDSSPPPER